MFDRESRMWQAELLKECQRSEQHVVQKPSASGQMEHSMAVMTEASFGKLMLDPARPNRLLTWEVAPWATCLMARATSSWLTHAR